MILCILFILSILNKCFGEIIINALAYSHHVEGQIYTPLVDEFNNYSKENNLNITLNIELLTLKNATFDVGGYASTVEKYLKKKENSTYEILFYDNLYASKFQKYFLDLSEHLPKNHTEMFSKGITSQTSVFNNRWVGLPVSIEYTVLYRNDALLKKYGQNIPDTWEKLIETGKYILSQENDDELIGYNGLFPDKELGMCSLYEFIYSFRKTKDDPFPKPKGDEIKEALETLKKIKTEISSDIIFKSADDLTKEKLNGDKFLFLKYWYMPSTKTPWSILPGSKEGLSGTTIGGYNIGINGAIKGERLKAAVEAVRYMTSYDIQKKFIIERELFSGIPELYEDKDVCDAIGIDKCNVFKSFQPIARPSYLTNDYETYSKKYRDNIYKYLFGDQSIDETLKENDSLLKKSKSGTSKRYSFNIMITSIFILLLKIIIL